MLNAAQLIRKDHKKVEGLFKRFAHAKSSEAKRRIADQVVEELEIHSRIEEEIFYPAVKQALEEEEVVDEARGDHAKARQIIEELKTLGSEDGSFDECFAVLVESVRQHVEEEEGELLPQIEHSELDLSACGEQMSELKEELTGNGSHQPPGDSPARHRRGGRSRVKRRAS